MTAQTVRVTARPRKDAEVPSGLPVDLDLPTIEGMFHMRQEDAAASLVRFSSYAMDTAV